VPQFAVDTTPKIGIVWDPAWPIPATYWFTKMGDDEATEGLGSLYQMVEPWKYTLLPAIGETDTLGFWFVAIKDNDGDIRYSQIFDIVAGLGPGVVELAADQPNYAPAKAGDAMTLESGERDAVAAATLGLVNGVVPGISLAGALRVALAALAGKCSIAGNTIAFRNPADTKTVISAVFDAAGNRLSVTLDVS